MDEITNKKIEGCPPNVITCVSQPPVATPTDLCPDVSCPIKVEVVNSQPLENVIQSDSIAIAGNDLNGTNTAVTGYIGLSDSFDTNVISGKIQSIAIIVYDADTSLVAGSLPNEFIVRYPSGNEVPMVKGQTNLFSVVKDTDSELAREFRFTANGTAKGAILYTYI